MNYHGAEGLEFGNGNTKLDPAVLAGNFLFFYFLFFIFFFFTRRNDFLVFSLE